MEPSLQRRVQRYGWDKASQYYESYWQKQLKLAQDRLLAVAALRKGEEVIDIACGTGLVSFPAATLVTEEGMVLGTDISERMVELATALAKQMKCINVRFERMDADELVAKDESFDVAICALGLMYMTDPIQALKEMHRVLKPGGRAAVAVWGERAHCGWSQLFEIVDRRVSSDVCPLFFNLGNGNLLEKSFELAGFTHIHVERLNTFLEYQSSEEACGAAFEGGPVALPYFKFSETVKSEVQIEYLDSISSFKKDKGYAVPAEFLVAVAQKDPRLKIPG